MSGLYYLVLQKDYQKEESTWEPSPAVIHLQKLISTFHKKYLEKPIATSLPQDSTLPIARPSVPKKPKQKRGHLNKRTNKRGRNQGIKLQSLTQLAVLFVALDLELMLKSLIQNFQKSCPYPSISIRFPSSLFQLGFGGFSLPSKQQMIGFPPRFLIEFRRFFIDRAPGFPLSSLGGFFIN